MALIELADSCAFADIGVDSLLSLVITSRFREELHLEMAFDDLFSAYPTMADLRLFLRQHASGSSGAPLTAAVDVESPPTEACWPAAQITSVAGLDNWNAALSIISEESGIAVSELTEDRAFADLGIDSLLTLVIGSRFREELGMGMDPGSIFSEYPNVKDVRSLFVRDQSSTEGISTPSQTDVMEDDSDGQPSGSSGDGISSDEDYSLVSSKVVPDATSITLQGNPANASKLLFLFPDGAGSATSYSSIPRVHPAVSVVGLNSPYRKQPHLFKCTVDDLIASYILEIRRRQPVGPYHFGGWSAGGILAYRAAQGMIESGETVASLVLIDSPVPKGLDRLPQHFYDFCNEIHLFGQTAGGEKVAKEVPEWLVPHFNATIDTLHEYVATPLPADRLPHASLIWACDSVMDGTIVPRPAPHADDTEGMRFLTEPRTDFSGNGWEALFPGQDLWIQRAENANHFTMMVSSLPSTLHVSQWLIR